MNATTGEENWRHDFPTDTRTWVRCRSLAYLDTSTPLEQPTVEGATPVTPFSLSEGAGCEKCIYMNTIDNIIDAVLVALDAETGALCEGLGDAGTIALKQGLGVKKAPLYALTSPPLRQAPPSSWAVVLPTT
ncbi:MAG: hypothetical protein HWE33_14520 [Rhodobacteraceae bacterium]|nr:hypothetical protein [Paracoccaceae bacterium]